jgi:hypothetical protein
VLHDVAMPKAPVPPAESPASFLSSDASRLVGDQRERRRCSARFSSPFEPSPPSPSRTALEFARNGYRIRVNSIHPSVIQTDMGHSASCRSTQIGDNACYIYFLVGVEVGLEDIRFYTGDDHEASANRRLPMRQDPL